MDNPKNGAILSGMISRNFNLSMFYLMTYVNGFNFNST